MASESELVALSDELCSKLLETGTACIEPAIYRCHKCAALFCIDHASEVDPKRFCSSCLVVADINLQFENLTAVDGTKVPGRLLRPVGAAFTETNKLLHDMTDEELKLFIQQYVVLVHEAEQLKTFREITLAHAKHVAFEKKLAKIEKTSGEIYFPSAKQSRPHVVKQAKAKLDPIATLAAKMRAAGITPEALQALINAKKGAKP